MYKGRVRDPTRGLGPVTHGQSDAAGEVHGAELLPLAFHYGGTVGIGSGDVLGAPHLFLLVPMAQVMHQSSNVTFNAALSLALLPASRVTEVVARGTPPLRSDWWVLVDLLGEAALRTPWPTISGKARDQGTQSPPRSARDVASPRHRLPTAHSAELRTAYPTGALSRSLCNP